MCRSRRKSDNLGVTIARCDLPSVAYSPLMLTSAVTKALRGLFSRRRNIPALLALSLAVAGALEAEPASINTGRSSLFVIIGAPGEEEFGRSFAESATQWETTAKRAGAKELILGLKTNEAASTREQLQQALAQETKEGPGELWLVFIGHGTFDGKEAKFAMRGPDISATELASWLQPFRRPVAVVDAASASAPFLTKLSATNRVVVTATRSGGEVNYSRFGRFFSEAVASPDADLDKDGQTSLLEAFLMASRRVKEFYETEGRLVTEHALLDDNGDGLGTPPDWFRGIRATKAAKDGAPLDGLRAHQFHLVRSEAELKLPPEIRAKRDELEVAVAKLRDSKKSLPEEEYYQKLEVLLLELARLYEGSAGAGR